MSVKAPSIVLYVKFKVFVKQLVSFLKSAHGFAVKRRFQMICNTVKLILL